MPEDAEHRLREITVYGPKAGMLIVDGRILRVIPLPHPLPHPLATSAVITVKGGPMGTANINVDTTTSKARLTWVDDHGDTDATPPTNAAATWSSDNPAVLTVAADPSDPLAAVITPVAEGSANISVTLTDSTTGAALTLPDGTPFPAPTPVTQAVTAGPAVLAQEGTTA